MVLCYEQVLIIENLLIKSQKFHMKANWLTNDFIGKDLYAPFVKKDIECIEG